MSDQTKSDAAGKPEPGPTPWERFVSLARKVTQTPKAEVDKRERKWKDERAKRRERA
jgi:hypothetical protein